MGSDVDAAWVPDACRAVSEGYTCSVITDQLMVDSTQTCADLGPTHRCLPFDPTSADPTVTGGTVIGFCQPVLAGPAIRPLWGGCNYLWELCEPGAFCQPFGGFDEGPGTCVPLCDTADPAGPQARCVDTGGPADATCLSISLQCDPPTPRPRPSPRPRPRPSPRP